MFHSSIGSMPLKIFLLGLCVSSVSGCGRKEDGGYDRVQLSGSVSLNGEPLPSGIIRFVPSAESGLPESAADILNGKYQSARGIPVGTYRVEITGAKQALEGAPSVDAPVDPKAAAQIVPGKYNKNSTLEVTVDSSAVQKDFDLKK